MRIGFDASATVPGYKRHAGRGIGRHVGELLGRIVGDHSCGDRTRVRVSSFSQPEVRLPRIVSPLVERAGQDRHTARQHLLFAPHLVDPAFVDRFDLLHFPAQSDAPAWSALPTVVTVHDLIPITHPEPCMAGLARSQRLKWLVARRLTRRALLRARHLIAVSDHTARELQSALGIAPERITVVYNGVSEAFFAPSPRSPAAIRAELGLPPERPIILSVAAADPRKNVGGLVESFGCLCRRMCPPLPLLVLVGAPGADAVHDAIAASAFRNSIHTVGVLSDASLVSLMHASTVFAFASLAEGFGLPPLEACATGLPVVCSDRTAMPEILGDAAMLCDPEDENAFAARMHRVLVDHAFARDIAARGRERARRFTWDNAAASTLAVYDAVRRDLNATHSRSKRSQARR